jgi:hypothetical protein
VLSVSCVGRRLVLGERTEEEVESVLDSRTGRHRARGLLFLRRDRAGRQARASELHNQTMTVTVFSEG